MSPANKRKRHPAFTGTVRCRCRFPLRAGVSQDLIGAVCVYCHSEVRGLAAELVAEGWIVASDGTPASKSALAICPDCAIREARY